MAAKPGAPSNPKSGKTGTDFVISASGHVITNHHVIDGCVGDIKGNLTGDAAATLRLVNSDATNDLALLQGPVETFKAFVKIRDRTCVDLQGLGRSGDALELRVATQLVGAVPRRGRHRRRGAPGASGEGDRAEGEAKHGRAIARAPPARQLVATCRW